MMLRPLWRGKLSARRLRLFAVACCRRIEPLLGSPLARSALEVAEQYADNRADEPELVAIHTALETEIKRMADPFTAKYRAALAVHITTWSPNFLPRWAVAAAVEAANARMYAAYENDPAARATWATTGRAVRATEAAAQCDLLRDIVGHPFHRLHSNPSWRTSNAVGLAEAVYGEQAFDRMPILADALEDAGCTNMEMLDHCRGAGRHVRGCWVVDLLLGKS
jgi:hypothetical protein